MNNESIDQPGSEPVEISIVVVTYNCADWIGRCFAAIPGALGDRRAEVVVVDNASADTSADAVAATAPEAKLIRNKTNVGFAAAVNQGVAASSGDWVLLLNPDTELRPGAIEAIVGFAEKHPDNGLYGGRTIRRDGTVEISSCWALPTVWSTFCFAVGLTGRNLPPRLFDPESMGSWPRDTVREVGMVTGCFLLTPRRVWDRLSGFNERYFVYGEDADLAARAHKAGYRPIITPDAVLVHEIGVSSVDSGAKMTLLLAGKITYVQEQWAGWRRTAGVGLLRAGAALHALAAKLTGRGQRWIGAWTDRARWWNGYPEGH